MVHIPRWQVIVIILVCVLGFGFAAPNMLSDKQIGSIPTWLPHKKINLGLDLQGGSHLLLKVDVDYVFREHIASIADSVRRELRSGRIRFAGLRIEGKGVRFRLRDVAQLEKARETLRSGVGSVTTGSLLSGGGREVTIEATSDGVFRITLTDQAIRARQDQAIAQSIEVVRRRVDELGTLEPIIQRQGDDRILLQVPGLEDPERLKRILGKTAKMTFHLVDQSEVPRKGMRPPAGTMLLPGDRDPDHLYLVYKRVEVGGEDLVDAQPTFQDGLSVVSFRFNSRGARRFGNTTRQNVGKPFAIVLDGKVISAPVIREPILGGRGIITGGFTAKSAGDLALLLRAGALPAPLEPVEERTVGASLGTDSIHQGEYASVIGLILVVAFMWLAYGRFGVMANVALAANMGLLLGSLSLLQATLTLPGIAGIVLTIGMAVDANVLIFERIREEVRSGRTPISAIDAGYRRALTTIIDSNLTTFIAALMLFFFGSGPIKGFAVTLSIGLATSMFSAIMITRVMVSNWLRRKRPAALPI
jgi:preprotein translocase subunit SecD